MNVRLFLAQRLTALILGPLVLIHLGLIVFAMASGLSAEEILGRTRGSAFWAGNYGLFVIAASIHAPIGIRTLVMEWTGAKGPVVDHGCIVLGLLLLALGFRAVFAVTG